MTQGGISSWNVKEGDAVQPGDVLAQVGAFHRFDCRFRRIRVPSILQHRRRLGWRRGVTRRAMWRRF